MSNIVASSGVNRCTTCAIRHRAVCGALSDVELTKLTKISKQRKYRAEQIIMSDDEPTDFFANIVSGTVKLTKLLPDGRQQIVGLQFAPDFLGRTYGVQTPYFAEAATDVELCSFPRKRFEEMLDVSAAFYVSDKNVASMSKSSLVRRSRTRGSNTVFSQDKCRR